MQAPGNRVQGFLGPGHVCAVMGFTEYEPIAHRFRVPIVISGFEPLDMLEGVLRTVRQLEAGQATVENQYGRAVCRDGNSQSLKLMNDVFEVCDRKRRGVGLIPSPPLWPPGRDAPGWHECSQSRHATLRCS